MRRQLRYHIVIRGTARAPHQTTRWVAGVRGPPPKKGMQSDGEPQRTQKRLSIPGGKIRFSLGT